MRDLQRQTGSVIKLPQQGTTTSEETTVHILGPFFSVQVGSSELLLIKRGNIMLEAVVIRLFIFIFLGNYFYRWLLLKGKCFSHYSQPSVASELSSRCQPPPAAGGAVADPQHHGCSEVTTRETTS